MICVLGASGAVGAAAAAALTGAGAGPLRLVGRDEERLAAVAGAVGAAEIRPADVLDPKALAAALNGCDLLVNCAGPARTLSRPVAAAAADAGLNLVDAGQTDTPAPVAPGCTAVSGAGALPGLSGLLPRLAARGLGSVSNLSVYVAVRDRFTRAGAVDYLDGVLGAETVPGAEWVSGAVVTAERARAVVSLPGLTDAAALAYVDSEARRVASALAVGRGSWYSVHADSTVADTVAAARGMPFSEAVEAVRRASVLDAAGRDPYVRYWVEASGRLGAHTDDPTPAVRTVTVRAGAIGTLTGTVAAAAACEVHAGRVARGAHHASDALDADAVIARLLAGPSRPTVQSTSHPLAALAVDEEGAL